MSPGNEQGAGRQGLFCILYVLAQDSTNTLFVTNKCHYYFIIGTAPSLTIVDIKALCDDGTITLMFNVCFNQ